jgi:hypothetical protein
MFLNYKRIIICNEISFIGDSIIFFWPLVNTIAKEFPQKEIQVFHPHPNVFKPIQTQVLNRSLTSFYKGENNAMDTIIIAFVKSDGELKNYLKLKEFPAVVKGMVGLDFSTLNMDKIAFNQSEYNEILVVENEVKYRNKNRSIDEKSGFPGLGKYFENVYEYAKICNETFFGLSNMNKAVEQNILVLDLSIYDVKSNIFSPSIASFNREFVLLNLIAGTIKKDVLEEYDSLVIWIQKVVSNCLKENLDVYILANDNFPNLRADLETHADNLFFLKEDSLPYWTYLIKNTEMVYSIDTGFLHISHVLNKNTFGFGGDVDFWFFKDRRVDLKKNS